MQLIKGDRWEFCEHHQEGLRNEKCAECEANKGAEFSVVAVTDNSLSVVTTGGQKINFTSQPTPKTPDSTDPSAI